MQAKRRSALAPIRNRLFGLLQVVVRESAQDSDEGRLRRRGLCEQRIEPCDRFGGIRCRAAAALPSRAS